MNNLGLGLVTCKDRFEGIKGIENKLKKLMMLLELYKNLGVLEYRVAKLITTEELYYSVQSFMEIVEDEIRAIKDMK